MRAMSTQFAPYQFAAAKEPMVVVEIAFDAAFTDLVYISSHADTPLPPGAVAVPNCLAKVTSTSQQIQPDQGRSSIGTISLEVIDKAGAFSAILKARDDAGKGIRYSRVRVYQGFRGMDWTAISSNLIQTQIVDDLAYGEGVYKISCADVQRQIRDDIFTLVTTSLSQPITAAAMLIPVFSVDGFQRVQHGTTYTDAPSQKVGYIKIDDEVIRWTSTTTDADLGLCFVVGERGVLGSKAADHDIDTSASADRKTEISEFVYLELPAVKLAYALLTGSLYGQPGEHLPDGWNLGIAGAYVRTTDFVSIGSDLWNTATDDGLVVRFAGEDEQDGKQFIEQQLCLLLGCFMPVYSNGELGLRRFTSILHNAPHDYQIDHSNAVKLSDLSIDIRSVYNVLSVEWNYDYLRDKLTRQKILIDDESRSKYKATPTKALQFRGLHGSRHTTTTVEGLFDRLRDRYAAPPHRLKVRCLPQLNIVEVGDIVRVKSDGIRDYFTGGTIDRAFEVQRATIDWVSGQVDLELFGSTLPAGPIAPANPGNGNPDADNAILPDAYYTGSGTNIVGYGGVTTTLAGAVRHITAGSGLVGGDTLSAGRYFCNGDLELNSGVTLPFTKNVLLVVKGHLQINGKFDGKARGSNGGAVATSSGAPLNGDGIYRVNYGVPGYIGPTVSGGGTSNYLQFGKDRWNWTAWEGWKTDGQVASVPRLDLSVDASGNLQGLIPNGQGTSGASGRNSFNDDTHNNNYYQDGGAGGKGGACLVIVARGISFGAAGQIDSSGGDGLIGTTNHVLVGGAGAGGAPGAVIFVIDGIGNEVPDLASVTAKFGASPLQSNTHIMAGTTEQYHLPDGESLTSYFVGYGATPPDLSAYGGASRILFVPPTNVPVVDVPDQSQKPLGISLAAFANTPRTPAGDRSSIEVTVTPPADTNYYYANIYYRKDGDALVYSGAADDEWVFVVPSDGAAYEVRAYAVSKAGVESTDYVSAEISLANTQAAVLATVTGLTLEQAFVGASARIKWDAVDGAETYVVSVYAGSPTQILKRTVDVGNALRFEYTYEDAIADGGPWRDIQFQVRGKNPSRLSGLWAVTSASNPQMGAPVGVQVGSIGRTISVSAARPTATDYAGTKFVMSSTSGFNPSTTTPFYDGLETAALKSGVSPGTYYVRLAHYDTFGVDSLTWSAEFSVSVIDLAGGIPTVPNASTITTLVDELHWAVLSLHDNNLWVWNGVNAYLNTADGANLIANSIGASKIAVSMLSAISANLGLVTAGLFKTDPSNGFRVEIEGGSALPFWLGTGSKTTGNAKLYIDTSGNLVANGLQIAAGVGYANISDKPTSLAGLNSGEGSKLAGIAAGADATQSALTAGVTITGGGITIGSGGSIKGGKTSSTAGTGFFMGYTGSAYVLSLGGSSGPGLTWDGLALTIRGSGGATIFATGTGLDYSVITGTKPAANADNTASNIAAGFAGQGAFATLNALNAGNITTYIASAAIPRALIGALNVGTADIVDLNVTTLKIAGDAVSVTIGASVSYWGTAYATITVTSNDLPPGSSTVPILVTGSADSVADIWFDMGVNQSGSLTSSGNLFAALPPAGVSAFTIIYAATPGTYRFDCFDHGAGNAADANSRRRTITISLGKR
ncbi:MAG: hypothetical protein JWM78_1674 [Verrucomicrobiaceae bacterium]|nr:hypothetical protein [Verrucomicrobiaceae bacterium]